MLTAMKGYNVDGEGFLSPPSLGRHIGEKLDGPVVTARCFYLYNNGRHMNNAYPSAFDFLKADDTIPVENCSCGIYGLKLDEDGNTRIRNLVRLLSYIQKAHEYTVRQSAIAVVGMYGKVIEGETGYRAERAIIKRLTLLTNGRQFSRHFIERMGGRYHVNVSQVVVKNQNEGYMGNTLNKIMEEIMRK